MSGWSTLNEKNPRVSILINNYNYSRFLRRAIDSALGQDYPSFEVIVVDDGSTDDSLSIARSYGDMIDLVAKSNGGQASCFNVGYARSSGDVICLLDSDDSFFPDKLRHIADLYAANTRAGWIHHSLERRNSNDELLTPEILKSPGMIDYRPNLVLGLPGKRFPATTALTFKRNVLEKLLPMPERTGISIGDHYLKYGAAALSPGIRLSELLATQYIHGTNLYTQMRERKTQVNIYLATATALRDRVPLAEGFADNLFATASVLSRGKNPQELYIYKKGSKIVSKIRILFWLLIKRTKTILGGKISGG